MIVELDCIDVWAGRLGKDRGEKLKRPKPPAVLPYMTALWDTRCLPLTCRSHKMSS